VIVKKPGAELNEADVKRYLADKIAKWWMPDLVIFADDLPHTGTGKILKTELRARYKDLKLEG
jgi:fatty-acyl-CoA synthase